MYLTTRKAIFILTVLQRDPIGLVHNVTFFTSSHSPPQTARHKPHTNNICGPSAVIYAYMGEFHTGLTRSKAIIWSCCFVSLGTIALPGMSVFCFSGDHCLARYVRVLFLWGPLPCQVCRCFVSLGTITLPGLAWAIIPQPWRVQLPWCTYSSWRVFLVVCSVPGLITAILLGVFLPESPRFLYSQGRYDETLAVLRRIFSINTSCPPQQYPLIELSTDPDQTLVKSNNRSIKCLIKSMCDQTRSLFSAPHVVNLIHICALQFGLFSCKAPYDSSTSVDPRLVPAGALQVQYWLCLPLNGIVKIVNK
uniref:Uncharacterized protein n=1 Tax=Timema douglasi TaxID=61478 RepID=A0A7R8ZGD0_TIMDO|nr:unnamed protein product [Timema douglasi]